MIYLFALLLLANAEEEKLFKASDKTSYSIKNRIPRPGDLLFFTEGLTFVSDDVLLESTGLYGDSEIHYI
jgi:glutamine cyclotransferase